MATIELVSQDSGGAPADALARVVSERGRSANFYRMYANSPETFGPVCSLVWSLWAAHEVDRATIELTILRVSQLVGAEYEWTHHRGMAADAGVTEEQITSLIRWREAACFDPARQALLAVVDAAVSEPRVPAEAVAELQRHYSDAQVVDLFTVIGLYRMVGQMLVGFDIGFEDWAPRVAAEWEQLMDQRHD